MANKPTNKYRKVILGFLFLSFFYSMMLPYSLVKPLSVQQEFFAEDQLYTVLVLSLTNSLYIPVRETNIAHINLLAFATDLASIVFQNQVKDIQLNLPKYSTCVHSGNFQNVPTYLQKCLLRI